MVIYQCNKKLNKLYTWGRPFPSIPFDQGHSQFFRVAALRFWTLKPFVSSFPILVSLSVSLSTQNKGAADPPSCCLGCCLHSSVVSEAQSCQLSAASRTQFALKRQENFQFLKTHFLSTLTAKYFMPSGPVAPWGPACRDLSACHYDEKMGP